MIFLIFTKKKNITKLFIKYYSISKKCSCVEHLEWIVNIFFLQLIKSSNWSALDVNTGRNRNFISRVVLSAWQFTRECFSFPQGRRNSKIIYEIQLIVISKYRNTINCSAMRYRKTIDVSYQLLVNY